MGALCSKNFSGEIDKELSNPYADVLNKESDLAATPMRRSTKKQTQDNPDQQQEGRQIHRKGSQNDSDDFYDGIPRIPVALSHKSRSMKSTQAAVVKVSEVGSLIGKAGTMGFGKAVEVLDVLGSSMTDLNSRSGFVSGGILRGTKVSILAFEVANTVVKGCKLINSVSEKRITHVKEVLLPSQGVQKLVSKDMDQLLKIVAHDKREELELFSAEVVRFGNRCKDPQWHNLERYFQKQNLELDSQNLVTEEVESMMDQLMSLVQCTSELYHELHSLDRFEQEYHCKQKDEGEDVILRSEIKKQKKLVKNLKKRSLWSRSLEEVIEKLVDIVLYVRMRIQDNFNTDGLSEDTEEQVEPSECGYQRLGPAGLALHYANMILQIDGIVARSSSMTLTARDSLYQSLPPTIKSTLRSKLQTFEVKKEISIAEIKVEMETTLQWLVPLATNTVKSHHGFGWVGEWANAGLDRAASSQNELVRVDTLYHADKGKTEAYITNQLLWLHHLIQKTRASNVGMTTLPSLRTSSFTTPNSSQTLEDKDILLEAFRSKRNAARSKSEDFDTAKDSPLRKHKRMSKSSHQSPSRGSKELLLSESQPHVSGSCTVDSGMETPKPLDSVDTVHVVG
ncbi:hypothetical protein V2J09_007950 [Rumex salicifolius]